MKSVWIALSIAASLTIISTQSQASVPNLPPKIPKSLVQYLVDEHCGFPNPTPKATTKLEFACFDNKPASKNAVADYQIRLIPLLARDFNKDGYRDLAIELESEGALGGNVHSNSTIYYLLLDRHQRIKDSVEVLLYAPFSEEIVDYDIQDQRITYRAVPNFRVSPEAYEDGSLIAPERQFSIQWQKGRPVEISD